MNDFKMANSCGRVIFPIIFAGCQPWKSMTVNLSTTWKWSNVQTWKFVTVNFQQGSQVCSAATSRKYWWPGNFALLQYTVDVPGILPCHTYVNSGWSHACLLVACWLCNFLINGIHIEGLYHDIPFFCLQFTQQTARELGLVGWVKNTNHDTVVGTVQGPEDKIQQMYVCI
jgi:hypothetical protein